MAPTPQATPPRMLQLAVVTDKEGRTMLDGVACSFLYNTIGEQVLACQAMKRLPFARPFEERINQWQHVLMNAERSLHKIVHAQASCTL